MKPISAAIAVLLSLAISAQAQSAAPGAPASGEGKTAQPVRPQMARMDDAKYKDWLSRWERNIVSDARNRSCDKEMGEEIGWLMTPFVEGFHYGYLATGDTKWVDMLFDWADSWIKRGVKEPDGCVGWPKKGAAGTEVDKLNAYNADSLLGEAMVLRPMVRLSIEILKTPALKARYGAKAQEYVKLSEQVFEKWDKRGSWHDTSDGGCISVVHPFGIDAKGDNWTGGYETRKDAKSGFSHPDNKANAVARWLLAMSDATGKAVYKERAEKWFRLMKSRMKLNADGATYEIWNYWQPAGPWDYKPDGSPKHWVGVHPNAGYYELDTEGIVDAYEHGLVFTKQDIDRLIATAIAAKRYWTALAPYDKTIQAKFEAAHKPDGWGGLGATPWYLSLQR